MFTIYWSSVVIGLLFGFAIGVAMAFYATWSTERKMFKESGSEFSDGFRKGWDCGIEHQQLMDKKYNQR